MAEDDREHSERLLKIYQRNLEYLETQAAAFGGEQNVPLSIMNQLIETRQKVADLQAQISPSAQPAAPQPQPIPTPSPPQPEPLEVTLDFELQDQGAHITWRSNLTGATVTTFTPPYDAVTLPLTIRALDALQYPNYPNWVNEDEQRHFSFSDQEQDLLKALGIWVDGRIAADAYQTVGQALYNGLGSTGQSVLKAVRNASIFQRLTANYVLRFPRQAINLASLPWELLWDKDSNQAVLIRGNSIDSCERYVDLDIAIPPPLAAGQQLHILALSPNYNIPVQVRQAEQSARLKTWDKLKAAGKITYDELSPLTVSGLNDYLLNASDRPDIIHFFGHGVYRNGKGYLLFDDDAGGKELVSAERLASILGDIRLIVIHACQSAMADDEGGLLTGVAPALSIVTGAVVAMQLTVRITAATRFTQVFYDQLLGRGSSLQQAVSRGRQILFTEAPDGASWYVPTLYIRSSTQQPVYLIR